MTTQRRDSGPTWLIWWFVAVLAVAWPLAAFARYPSDGQPGQLTGAGWVAEIIWLAVLAATGTAIATMRSKAAKNDGVL